MAGSFDGKVAMVTGAGSGIGRATALALQLVNQAAGNRCQLDQRLQPLRAFDNAPTVKNGNPGNDRQGNQRNDGQHGDSATDPNIRQLEHCGRPNPS